MVPQGSLLGLAPFDVLVGDMDSGIEAGGTTLCGAVDSLEGRDGIHRVLGRLQR